VAAGGNRLAHAEPRRRGEKGISREGAKLGKGGGGTHGVDSSFQRPMPYKKKKKALGLTSASKFDCV
jgi:hypothetical protein